ncbi:hypothetical protein JCM15519_10750 [Fundidesulfovibrio butyratiphilus]
MTVTNQGVSLSPAPADLRFGKDPFLDAWILHFLSENTLVYAIDPQDNASPEQLRFMVVLGTDQIFVPCSDEMLALLLEKSPEPLLMDSYAQAWRQVQDLIEQNAQGDYDKMMIRSLCDHKYRQALSDRVMIPSRLLKRLTTIVLAQTGQDDPGRERRKSLNRRALRFLQSSSMHRLLTTCPGISPACQSIEDMRFELNMLEISRLLALSVWEDLWVGDGSGPSPEQVEALMAASPDMEPLRRILGSSGIKSMKILYVPETSGGVIFDILVARCLIRMGHRVVLALKEGFALDSPTFWDAQDDPTLNQALLGATFLADTRATKNALLRAVRENPLLVISDGSRERLNLHKVSVTFSRAWKECDLILVKGESNYRRTLLTSARFTRDILSVRRTPEGATLVEAKPRPGGVRTFTEPEISAKSEAIISRMRSEKAAGKSIMFYSAIVGSIPHETDMAIKVLNTFVAHLRSRLTGTYVVNPAEHFEEGMDADDLMYMWEKVQRSGLINVWRFQTYADIETAFELMGRPVPPVWAGKDATYSTGCTKEMHIAQDVQRSQPELQIIGPSPEKFLRRREYGVGKFFDAAIAAR